MKIYKLRKLYISIFLPVVLFAYVNQKYEFSETVFTDDFSTYKTGSISPSVGSHTEYHFLKEAQPKGNRKITSFYHNPTLEFTPADSPLRSGLVFRYKNDRQYYFFGIQHNNKFHLNEIFPAFFSPYCFTGTDSTFAQGKIALMADGPSTFYSVKVETTKAEIMRIEKVEKALHIIS